MFNFDQAVAEYTRAIELAPHDPNTYLSRAWVWQKRGKSRCPEG